MYQHTSVFDVEVTLSCHGWRTTLFPGKKGSRPQDESWSGKVKIADLFRMLCEHIGSRFNQQDKKLDEIMKMTRGTSQREASLEHDAPQPRLAMEADGSANTKTHERTEGAATAVQAMHGDSYTAQKVQDGPKTCSTSFGMKVESPALVGRTFWSRTAMRRPNRVSHPWRCASQHLPVAYYTPAYLLLIKHKGPTFPHNFFFGASEKRARRKILVQQDRHSPSTTIPGTQRRWKRSQGKTWFLTQADSQVVCAVARSGRAMHVVSWGVD